MYLFEWLVEVFQELQRFYLDNFSPGGPARRMERRLRVMFGRGEIDRDTFFRLHNSLQKGYYIEGELHTFHQQAVTRMQREGRYLARQFDPAVDRGLESLYQNRARLEEVRQEMEQALNTILRQREWIQQQADALREDAQRALPDENTARSYLEVRQDLLARIGVLDQRAEAVRQNLHQLSALKAELGVREAELMLVDSQEHYANVKLQLPRS